MIGQSIGPYQVVAKLGEGGMGEVYRAADTQLGRDVALKILPDAFARDPDRLARFEREARTLAALNHPNIASIYGVAARDSVRALVMELVPGPTLEEVIASVAPAPLPMPDALAIARQIADALESAHEAGIVHRDLKPANVKVRDDGTVKVLDFGLAKAVDHGSHVAPTPATLANSPTLLSPATTHVGVILGTAAYMAPEQAKGHAIDRRADVWAFGVILYELLTGRRLFAAPDVSETLAAVLSRAPDWQALPAATPGEIRRLLSRCLARDRRARLDSMAAARLEIDDVLAGREPVPGREPPSASGRRALPLPVAAGALLVVLLAGVLIGTWLRRAPTSDEPVMITSIAAPQGVVAAFDRGFAISPDGRTLVTSARAADGRRALWSRRLADPLFERLSGTDGGMYPFWSPDGADIGFFADGQLRRVPGAGGTVQTICEVGGDSPSASWNDRNQILFSGGAAEEFQLVAASGGAVTSVPAGQFSTRPQWVTGTDRFLFLERGPANPRIMAGQVGGGSPSLLMELDAVNSGALLTPSNILVFNRAGALYAQRFDPSAVAVTGDARVVGPAAGTPRGWFAASASAAALVILSNPTAVTGGNPGDPLARLRWSDRQGRIVGEIGDPGRYWTLRLSHDAQRVVINPDGDLWTIDARTGIRTRLTSGPGESVSAVWSRDARRIIHRAQGALLVRPSDGDGEAQAVLTLGNRALNPNDWSPDGTSVLLAARPNAQQPTLDLDVLSLVDGTVRSWLATPFDEHQARFSPNGRWVAYMSNVTGVPEVYARPFAGGAAVRLSTHGGEHPIWRADGRELFHLTPSDEIMGVDVSALETTRAPGSASRLFRLVLNDVIRDRYSPYDVSPDGQRFLLNIADVPEPLTLINRYERQVPPAR